MFLIPPACFSQTGRASARQFSFFPSFCLWLLVLWCISQKHLLNGGAHGFLMPLACLSCGVFLEGVYKALCACVSGLPNLGYACASSSSPPPLPSTPFPLTCRLDATFTTTSNAPTRAPALRTPLRPSKGEAIHHRATRHARFRERGVVMGKCKH